MIWLWFILIFLLTVILWLILRPIPVSGFVSHPNPATSYEEALTRVKAMQAEDNQDPVQEVCITKLFDHGSQTENTIVLLHGFTNCPEQFDQLGKGFFDAGFNVFIPRMPYHGLSDRLTKELANLTAEDLCAFGDNAVDIAQGLGEKVCVMGLSAGGNIAAWLAQHRTDLDSVFPIAPLIGLAFIPSTRLAGFLIRLRSIIPDFYMWWDPRTGAENPFSPAYAYPGYPIRSLLELFRLADWIQSQAKRKPVAAKSVVMVINDNESSVSNPAILKLLETWRQHGRGILSEYHFEKDIKLLHDFITPEYNASRVDTYPRLIEAVKNANAELMAQDLRKK